MVMFPDSDIEYDESFLHDWLWYSWVFPSQFVIPAKKISIFYTVIWRSLNYVLNKDKMDIHICFYNLDSGTISTRYLDSCFVFRPNTSVLSGEIINSIKDLDASRMIMRGMDGPNVNWCVFDKINAEREKHNHVPLFSVRSCGLHLIHGAFETGMISNQWEIGKILKSMFKGCVHYIFASLFYMSKGEHWWNKKKCFLFHFENSFRSWDNQNMTFQIFECHDIIKCLSMKHKTHFNE